MDETLATRIVDGLCTSMHRFLDTRDLAVCFQEDGDRLTHTISALVEDGVLTYVAPDTYEHRPQLYRDRHALHDLASFLRRGEFTYESLESAAEAWGFIDQIPVGRIMVVTSGEGGVVDTIYGQVEYVHVGRDARWFCSPDVIRDREPITSLGLASKQRCLNDLVELGRSLDLVIWDDFYDDVEGDIRDGCFGDGVWNADF